MTDREKKQILDETVLIIPSLNPDELLIKTVCGMSEAGFSKILIVNDGSDAEHLQPFTAAAAKTGCTVIGYEKNMGKGHALKYAYEYVLEKCPYAFGVVTCDGDGQHSPEDCVNVAVRLHDCGNKIIFGARDFSNDNVPARNRFGNVITRTLFNMLYGLKLMDAQTGLRGFPVSVLPLMLTVEGERFEYESNVLICIGDEKLPYENLPIKTIYPEGSNKRSHFRVVRDSYRVYKPVILYLLSSLSSGIIDLGLFTLLMLFFAAFKHDSAVLFSTVIARMCSSLYNYTVNKRVVFRNKTGVKKSLFKYCLLAICQMLVSYKSVSLLSAALGLTGGLAGIIKLIVDIILFFISFQIQRRWVFAK